MARLFHPLLLLLANATHRELVAQIQYLKAENAILRSKLPKRVTVTPSERSRLVKLGSKVRKFMGELITIDHTSPDVMDGEGFRRREIGGLYEMCMSC